MKLRLQSSVFPRYRFAIVMEIAIVIMGMRHLAVASQEMEAVLIVMDPQL